MLDASGKISLLDAGGAAVWTRTVEDSVRDVAIPAAGKEAYALSVREIVRFGLTGKAVFRVAPPPFPLHLAVRRDGEVFAVSAGQGLVRLYDAGGRELGGQRVRHAADHLALLAVELAEEPRRGRPVARPTLTAVVSGRGEITLLDHLGQPHWHVALGATAGPPDAAHDRIVVPSFDGVHAFLLDGTPAGLYDVGAPAVRAFLDDAAERLLVLDARNRLSLLAGRTGETLWHLPLPEDVADVSFASDGRAIAVALRSGPVERLDVMDGSAPAGIAIGGARPAAAPAASDPASGFLEMEEGARVRPRSRWRVPAAASAVELALLRGGAGVALLDRDRGELTLWNGGRAPSWRVAGLGPGCTLAAAGEGAPIVAAGPSGVHFFGTEAGPLARSGIEARTLAIAEESGAVLVGSRASRLHLFDAAGQPVWDVPVPGMRAAAISPNGMEIAVVRAGGTIAFQVRGRRGGWSRSVGGAGFLAEGEHGEADLHVCVAEEGVFFADATGRAGLVGTGGEVVLDAPLPGGRGAAELVTVPGKAILVRDTGGGWSRFLRDPWRLEPLSGAGGRSGHGESRFAVDPRGRLIEFRYDAREIASFDVLDGTVLWRRALDRMPHAVAVAPDGATLAAVVSGELVLYDLTSTGAGGSGGEPQRFLEL